jgi:hypothetical protein
MVYRIGELQYEKDFYEEWLVSPGLLLTGQFHDPGFRVDRVSSSDAWV